MLMISPTMLLDPMMDLCLWKLTVSRKAKGSTKARTKVVALLEAVSEQVTGYWSGTRPWSHQQRQRQGEDKGEIKRKEGNQKGGSERRRQK